MALTLYAHPLSSYCWKALIALYEANVPFTMVQVDLGDARSRADFEAIWPMGRFPVLHDDSRGITLPESSVAIEYMDVHYPGAAPLLPPDPELRLQARLWDRFFDHYVHTPVQKIVADRLRAQGDRDPAGVAEAQALLTRAYDVAEQQMAGKSWAVGAVFSLADCAAAPALHYADRLVPLSGHTGLTAYLGRLSERPSFARVLREAEPYRHMFPG